MKHGIYPLSLTIVLLSIGCGIFVNGEEAEDTFKRCLQAMEKSMGAEHPDVGAIKSNLGKALMEAGKLGEAEKCLFPDARGTVR